MIFHLSQKFPNALRTTVFLVVVSIFYSGLGFHVKSALEGMKIISTCDQEGCLAEQYNPLQNLQDVKIIVHLEGFEVSNYSSTCLQKHLKFLWTDPVKQVGTPPPEC